MSFCKAKQSSGERIVATIEFDDLHQNFYQCPPYVKYNLYKIVYIVCPIIEFASPVWDCGKGHMGEQFLSP